MKMKNFALQWAAVLGAISVGIGAFGAHALKDFLMAQGRLETFETAISYQFYHTLALFGIGIMISKYDLKLLNYSAVSMITGIIIFSGSLYALCFTGITILGAITPLGGIAFILGWILLFWGIKKAG